MPQNTTNKSLRWIKLTKGYAMVMDWKTQYWLRWQFFPNWSTDSKQLIKIQKNLVELDMLILKLKTDTQRAKKSLLKKSKERRCSVEYHPSFSRQCDTGARIDKSVNETKYEI